jgi:hypothetical protein
MCHQYIALRIERLQGGGLPADVLSIDRMVVPAQAKFAMLTDSVSPDW